MQPGSTSGSLRPEEKVMITMDGNDEPLLGDVAQGEDCTWSLGK
jgi:hypothetical protein